MFILDLYKRNVTKLTEKLLRTLRSRNYCPAWTKDLCLRRKSHLSATLKCRQCFDALVPTVLGKYLSTYLLD